MSVLTSCAVCGVLFDTWVTSLEALCVDCETEWEKIK